MDSKSCIEIGLDAVDVDTTVEWSKYDPEELEVTSAVVTWAHPDGALKVGQELLELLSDEQKEQIVEDWRHDCASRAY